MSNIEYLRVPGQPVPYFVDYEQATAWINGLLPLGIKPGLSRMEKLMELLGQPQRRLKFIHVAGTNGKGSTCAFLENILLRAGYSVGSFTSPYLHRFTERIRFNGDEIPEADVVALANELKPLVDQLAQTELGSPTMFEVVTALAIVYFARQTCPYYVVWETGLGGLYDSTNIVTPLISVITNVGHDHQDLLGSTLPEIAAQKAGIIKSGVPVVSAVEQPDVVDVVERQALAKKTKLYLLGREFRYRALPARVDEQVFDFYGVFRDLKQLTLSLNGSFQLKNAAVALMTIEVMRQYYALIVDDDLLYEAFKQTAWPGRLELISEQPRLVLDGAHNPEGAEALVSALPAVYRYDRLHVLVGMLEQKNHREYLRHIMTVADTLILTEPAFRKALPAETLHELAVQVVQEHREQQKNGALDTDAQPLRTTEWICMADWQAALNALLERTSAGDLALVSGSLYMLADVRAHILNLGSSEKGW